MKSAYLFIGVVTLTSVPIAAAALSITAVRAPDAWDAVNTSATLALPSGASWITAPFVNTEQAGDTGAGTAVNPGNYPCGTGAGCSPFNPFEYGATGVKSTETFADALEDWEKIPFYAVGPSGKLNQPAAVLDMGGRFTGFELLWGSVDARNTLRFYLGDTLTATVTGDDVPEPMNDVADATWGWGASLVRISGLDFDRVVFTNDPAMNAFEFSNMSATPIPLPMAGWLLLTAVGAVGFAKRRARA